MKHFILLFPLLFSVIAFPAFAADAGWKITNFSSIVGVQTDGYMRVREIIHVDFGTLERHGIFREIPIGYTTSDGKGLALQAKVNSVTDGAKPVPYEMSNTNGNLRLKIGDPNTLVTGKQAYVIDYLLRGTVREFDGYDEVYWNATGNEWPVPIEHTEATFALPKDGVLQWSCYLGTRGDTEPCTAEKTSESLVHFESPRTLRPGEGLTFAVGFTKGVVPVLPPLSEDSSPAPKASPLAFGLSFLATLVAGVFLLARLWWRKGRDAKDNRTLKLFERETIIAEYDSPLGLRPGEIGVLLDETADTLDITATIVDLAVRGFLTIEEIPKKWFLGSMDYTLTKINADETKLLAYEKKLLDALFEKDRDTAAFSEIFSILKGEKPKAKDPTKKTVKTSDLKNTFYKDLAEIKALLYEHMAQEKLFSDDPSKVRVKYIALGIGLMILGILLFVLSGAIVSGILTGAGAGLVPCGIILIFLAWKGMPKRTARGHDAYLKAQGYKLFISQTEKYRQKFFEKENTFMEVLPYAIVFGITDKLAKAMKDMGVAPPSPSWYAGANTFNAATFANNMGDFSKSLSSAMASAPSSSGSGGGGSSGGGFGGGGGGSW